MKPSDGFMAVIFLIIQENSARPGDVPALSGTSPGSAVRLSFVRNWNYFWSVRLPVWQGTAIYSFFQENYHVSIYPGH